MSSQFQDTPSSESTATYEPPATLPALALTSLNALKHGATSFTLFLPEEDPAIFWHMLDEAFAQHQPANLQDADLVTNSVQARWYLARRQRVRGEYELRSHYGFLTPSTWPDEELHRINLFDRYLTQAERSLDRALRNVRHIRKDALDAQKTQELLTLKKQQFQFELDKWQRPQAERDERRKQQEAKEQELNQIIAQAHAERAPIQSSEELGGCVVRQHVYVGRKDGETIIDNIFPSNDAVRQIIAKSETYVTPPQQVVRDYRFSHGIPNEYEFLISEDFPRPLEMICGVRTFSSFDEWLLLADKEDELFPCDDDDDDETDEEASFQH